MWSQVTGTNSDQLDDAVFKATNSYRPRVRWSLGREILHNFWMLEQLH